MTQMQQVSAMDMVVAELTARRRRLEDSLGIAVVAPEVGSHGETEHLVAYAERQLDETVAAMMRSELAAVCGALDRIDDGTYGTCVGCGQRIPEERLLAVPAATYCVSCGAQRQS
jgi:DnaK suppressor protein